MAVHDSNTSTTPPAADRSRGRLYFWAGLAACVLGVGLGVGQFVLQILRTPWYTPALVTLGALLLLASVLQRPGVFRVLALLLMTAFAGWLWYSFGWGLKLPDYDGPARARDPFPAFTSTLADGRPFADADLRDGSRRAMVFFRGRW